MKIELATIQDVPELQELQRKAFGPQCIELGWEDAPPMTESLEHAYEEFAQCTTLKVKNEDGRIIGSIRGNVTDGSLYMGRLMVLPEYRQQGIGKQLFREIQRLLPHNRAWLCTCKQVPAPYEFYLREGFRPFKSEVVGSGLTWVYMEKSNMSLRPFLSNDASTILSWCKDKHAFRLWSADRYKEFPVQPEEMMEQYKGDNMYPLTAVAGDAIVGHILLRSPSEDKSGIRFGFVIVDDSKRAKDMASRCCASLSIMHSGNWMLRRSPSVCFAIISPPLNATSPSASTSQEKMPIRLTGRNGKAMKWKRN